jgi:hypothetical protein
MTELAQHERDSRLVVAGIEDLLRHAPQLNKALVEAPDLAVQVDDENAVGRRIQRGEEQRMLIVDADGGWRPFD